MTKVIVDAALRRKLNDLEGPLELCDDAGRVLAHVIPQPGAEDDLNPKITREELLRRKASSEPTYSTGEVLAHLGRL